LSDGRSLGVGRRERTVAVGPAIDAPPRADETGADETGADETGADETGADETGEFGTHWGTV
jgi:hypothetical protein